MIPDLPEVTEARRALRCLYIAVEQPVATDVEKRIEAAFSALASTTALRCLKHATIPPTILPPAKTECGLCMRDEGILVGRKEGP